MINMYISKMLNKTGPRGMVYYPAVDDTPSLDLKNYEVVNQAVNADNTYWIGIIDVSKRRHGYLSKDQNVRLIENKTVDFANFATWPVELFN